MMYPLTFVYDPFLYTALGAKYKEFEIELQNAYFEGDFDKYISTRRNLVRVRKNLAALEQLGWV